MHDRFGDRSLDSHGLGLHGGFGDRFLYRVLLRLVRRFRHRLLHHVVLNLDLRFGNRFLNRGVLGLVLGLGDLFVGGHQLFDLRCLGDHRGFVDVFDFGNRLEHGVCLIHCGCFNDRLSDRVLPLLNAGFRNWAICHDLFLDEHVFVVDAISRDRNLLVDGFRLESVRSNRGAVLTQGYG